MEQIEELLNCLRSVDYNALDEERRNELLDSRDDDPFDSQWCRVYNEVEALKAERNDSEEAEAGQSKVRERAFAIVAQNGGGELADYVSDDFGLIYDSLALGYRDEWLDWLIGVYRCREIPAGELCAPDNQKTEDD